MTMKSGLPNLVLPIGMLLAMGCGARSTLDSPADETTDSTGGSGGNLGSGGYPIDGILPSGTGGKQSTGGSTGGTGGYRVTGGAGGYYAGGGGYYAGGGRSGGAGGNVGGQAGFGPGGSPPSGGGTMSTGGLRTGGMMNTGGRAGGDGGSAVCAPTSRCDGSAGGGSGVIGRDSGADVQEAGRDGIAGADGTPATGGTVGTDGAIETGGSTCPGLASNEEMIDDLNDGNRFIPSLSGRVGSWTDSDDGTPGGTMFPDPVNNFTPTDTGDTCRKYAAYVKGGGFSDWGADFWFGLGSPYNASKYTGISFWAKVDSGTSAVLHVAFPDKDTYPDGGICKTNVTGPTACFDHYGSRPTLTTDWKKYTVSFSQISQDGWGLQGTKFDPSSLYEVLFQIPVNATFSIWIDDVAFTM